MKTKLLEDNNTDNLVILFESGAFIKAIEYSAVFMSELFGYKLYPNVDKKSWNLFLEVGFPKVKKDDIFNKLSLEKISFKFIYSDFSADDYIFGENENFREKIDLKKIKQDKIKF